MIDRKNDVALVRAALRRSRVECKRADAPTLTPSMRIALADLKLDELRVVYPGTKRYVLARNVEVVPLAEFAKATRCGRKSLYSPASTRPG